MSKSQQFLEFLKKSLERQPEAGAGRLVLCCVSGGADSVALFHGLLRLAPLLGFRLAVAHVHHGVRGEEADRDASFVRELCQKEGIPFYQKRLSFDKGDKVSEEKLRLGRLKAISDCAREIGASAALLGHHQDDLAETFLMRLLQGSGLKGLGAFGEQSRYEGLPLLRPMKDMPRDLILTFLKEGRITWREDSTNRDARFLRNRIRHELLPLLEKKFNPRMKSALARNAEHFSRLYSYIEKEGANLLERYVVPYPQNSSQPYLEYVSLREISSLPDLLLSEFLRLWIMRMRRSSLAPRFHEAEALVRLVKEDRSGSLRRLAGGIVAFKDLHRILLCKTTLPRSSSSSELLAEITPMLVSIQNQSFDFPWFKNKEALIRISRKHLPQGKEKRILKQDSIHFILRTRKMRGTKERGLVMIPLKGIAFPLLLRTRRPGDEIMASGQEKSLKKWFVEQRIPAPLRDHVAIVQDGAGTILSIGTRNMNPVIPRGGQILYIAWEYPLSK